MFLSRERPYNLTAYFAYLLNCMILTFVWCREFIFNFKTNDIKLGWLTLLVLILATSDDFENFLVLNRVTYGRRRAGPPITGIPFVNLENSRLRNQYNEKHRHRQNYWINVPRRATSKSINYMFVRGKVT